MSDRLGEGGAMLVRARLVDLGSRRGDLCLRVWGL